MPRVHGPVALDNESQTRYDGAPEPKPQPQEVADQLVRYFDLSIGPRVFLGIAQPRRGRPAPKTITSRLVISDLFTLAAP